MKETWRLINTHLFEENLFITCVYHGLNKTCWKNLKKCLLNDNWREPGIKCDDRARSICLYLKTFCRLYAGLRL